MQDCVDNRWAALETTLAGPGEGLFLPKPLHRKGMPPIPSKSTNLSKEVGGVLANFITNLVPGPRARLALGRVPVLSALQK